MPYVIGLVLALAVAAFARRSGFDRDRAFYPTVTIVVAAYYVLFATMTGSIQIVFKEVVLMSAFAVAAVVGFRSSLWIVAAALAGHGLLDIVHGHVLDNPGVPPFWPAFCATYDVAAGAVMAWMLKTGALTNAPREKRHAVR
jgi:hypothetical protein